MGRPLFPSSASQLLQVGHPTPRRSSASLGLLRHAVHQSSRYHPTVNSRPSPNTPPHDRHHCRNTSCSAGFPRAALCRSPTSWRHCAFGKSKCCLANRTVALGVTNNSWLAQRITFILLSHSMGSATRLESPSNRRRDSLRPATSPDKSCENFVQQQVLASRRPLKKMPHCRPV